MNNLWRRFFLIAPLVLVVIVLLTSCSGLPVEQAPISTSDTTDYWPTEGWRTSIPEQLGMDSDILAEMLEEIYTQQYDIDSVSVVRDGYLVLDVTNFPFRLGEMHIIHSCTKSIVSALIGIAIDQGHIESVDQPVTDLFPDRTITNLDSNKQAMTLEHLLTMSTGFDCRDSYLYRWHGLKQMRDSEDWVQFMLDLPMIAEPGSQFEYCNGASFLLSAIIQETTGKSTLEFAQENLFNDMGITNVDWPENPQGINIGWGELHMLPQDMAKIGYLYLNEGRWGDRRLVPSDWVKTSTREHVSATLQDGYGYQWWVTDSGMYMALGYAGQFIFVVPDQNMVVVFTSNLDDQDFYLPQRLLNEFIIPSAKSTKPLPANPEGFTRLDSALDTLATP